MDAETKELVFAENPFRRLRLPEAEKALREKPTAERFDVLMRYVDRVDPRGRLRLILVITRRLGRRVGATAQLKPKELRLTTAEMLETIRLISRRGHQEKDGIQSPEFAYEFKNGAIFFDRDRDKKGYQRRVPISSLTREEIDLYRSRQPTLDPDGPLFPSDGDPGRAIGVSELIQLLHAAEEMARADGYDRAVPVLYDSAFHGYRGLRATELENQGHRDAHIRFIVGWSCKVGNAKDDRYIVHDAHLLYAAVEGMRPVEIESEYREALAARDEEHALLLQRHEELQARYNRLEEQNAAMAVQLEQLNQQFGRLLASLESR